MKDYLINITNSSSNMLTASTPSGDIGSQYDYGVQRLVFTRPEEYTDLDMLLYFSSWTNIFVPVNIGTNNEFILEAHLTAGMMLTLQIAFSRNGVVLEHTNKLVFKLRESILRNSMTGGGQIPDHICELSDIAFTGASYSANTLSFKNKFGNIIGDVIIPSGSGGGTAGVSVHGELSGRDAPGQHPVSSITGLAEAISAGNNATLVEAKLYADSLSSNVSTISPDTAVNGFLPDKFLCVGSDGASLSTKDVPSGITLYIGTEENPVIMSSLPTGFCGILGFTKSNPNATGSNVTLNFTTECWGAIDRTGTLTYFTTFISMAWRIYSYYISGNSAIGQDSLSLRDIVRTNGSQTIGGVKTFSNPPESSPTPVNGNQLTNKSYVDSMFSELLSQLGASLDVSLLKSDVTVKLPTIKDLSDNIPIIEPFMEEFEIFSE